MKINITAQRKVKTRLLYTFAITAQRLQNLYENIDYEFVLTSPTVSNISFSSYLDGLQKGRVHTRTSLMSLSLLPQRCPTYLSHLIWMVYQKEESIREHRLWVCPYFPNGVQHIFLILFGWFTRRKSPYKNIAYEFVLTSPTVSNISFSSYLDGLQEGRVHTRILLMSLQDGR